MVAVFRLRVAVLRPMLAVFNRSFYHQDAWRSHMYRAHSKVDAPEFFETMEKARTLKKEINKKKREHEVKIKNAPDPRSWSESLEKRMVEWGLLHGASEQVTSELIKGFKKIYGFEESRLSRMRLVKKNKATQSSLGDAPEVHSPLPHDVLPSPQLSSKRPAEDSAGSGSDALSDCDSDLEVADGPSPATDLSQASGHLNLQHNLSFQPNGPSLSDGLSGRSNVASPSLATRCDMILAAAGTARGRKSGRGKKRPKRVVTTLGLATALFKSQGLGVGVGVGVGGGAAGGAGTAKAEGDVLMSASMGHRGFLDVVTTDRVPMLSSAHDVTPTPNHELPVRPSYRDFPSHPPGEGELALVHPVAPMRRHSYSASASDVMHLAAGHTVVTSPRDAADHPDHRHLLVSSTDGSFGPQSRDRSPSCDATLTHVAPPSRDVVPTGIFSPSRDISRAFFGAPSSDVTRPYGVIMQPPSRGVAHHVTPDPTSWSRGPWASESEPGSRHAEDRGLGDVTHLSFPRPS